MTIRSFLKAAADRVFGNPEERVLGEVRRALRQEGPDDFTDEVTQPDGARVWYGNGKIHQDDEPAVFHADGRQEWYRDGERGIKHANRTTEYFREGKQYRDTGVIFESTDGSRVINKGGYVSELRLSGREGVPASEEWFLEDSRIADGTRVLSDGTTLRFKGGKLDAVTAAVAAPDSPPGTKPPQPS